VSLDKCSVLDLAQLAAYWLGELDDAAQMQVEEHAFACAQCTQRLHFLAEIGAGVRALLWEGALAFAVTPAFLDELRAQGMHLREYRVAPGGRVNCTIAPRDDFVVSRLQAPLEGVARLDVEVHIEGELHERRNDIPFDPARGEVLLLPSAARLRAITAPTIHRMRLLAVEDGGERLIGEYRFNHTPSDDRP
jgi:anti-sigma factor RsiW